MKSDLEVVYRAVAGLDVHSRIIVACRRRLTPDGALEKEVHSFGTMTAQLRELGQWLGEWGVTVAALESTGVYWKPVWNILEGQVDLILVNAQRTKKRPAHKTDVKDCEWLAQLLQYGLLDRSFVPSRPIRELRDLTRHRAKLTSQRASTINRIHKTLEDANIKLGTVASDILGVSGRKMLQALAQGEQDPVKLADLALKKLRQKLPQLRESLTGRLTPHHQFLLEKLLAQVHFLEQQLQALDQQVAATCAPYLRQLQLLDTMPGVNARAAQNILAELGPDMQQFPTAGSLASWAGLCPSPQESAGKRKASHTRRGSKWLRRTLVEVAWAAVNKKDSYAAAQYRRLAGRRGKKRAIVAVAHSMLIAAYEMLSKSVEYVDLGGDYFDRTNKEKIKSTLLKRLEALGFQVALQPLDPVA